MDTLRTTKTLINVNNITLFLSCNDTREDKFIIRGVVKWIQMNKVNILLKIVDSEINILPVDEKQT